MTGRDRGAPTAGGVEVEGLWKGWGDQPVLCGVDLRVGTGSVTAILGSSGSGKTTLLRLLAGFTRADRGTITVDGRVLDGPGHHIGPAARSIGYVPQEGSLFPHLDVAANIGFGVARPLRRRRVSQLLEATGLGGLAGRYPHQLSGGQQQRVALARALASEPALVLLDEPFSSLDAALRASVRLDVSRILDAAGTTAIVVTHDQDEALSIADQVAVLRQGRIAQAGPPHELYTQPVDAELARFVGVANLVPGVVRSGRVDTAFGPLELHPAVPAASDGRAMTVLLRPEQIEVVAAGAGPVEGVATHYDYHGHDGTLTVAIHDAGLPASLAVRHATTGAAPAGSAIGLRAHGTVWAWPHLAPVDHLATQ